MVNLVKIIAWKDPQRVTTKTFTCAYCGNDVASDLGYAVRDLNVPGRVIHGIDGGARICPQCQMLTVFSMFGDEWTPVAPPGKPIDNVPQDLATLYDEARASAGAGAYTAAVLTCRKILMHIAVQEGAKPGQSFVAYVDHLTQKGFLPPRARPWVDHIRVRGNEANHDIAVMTQEDAKVLITFVEMVLRFLYEFPSMVPQLPPPANP